MNTISAHKYVSPRSRALTPDEAEVRRIAYALKIPTPEAMNAAANALAPLLDSAEAQDTQFVFMPVPSSTGSIEANRAFANEIAAVLRAGGIARPRRHVHVKTTVGRMHPVESSCARRRRGGAGLTVDEHAMIRVAGPLTATGTAYYFVDNVASTGATLEACRAALGFGDGVVWADQGLCPRTAPPREEPDTRTPPPISRTAKRWFTWGNNVKGSLAAGNFVRTAGNALVQYTNASFIGFIDTVPATMIEVTDHTLIDRFVPRICGR